MLEIALESKKRYIFPKAKIKKSSTFHRLNVRIEFFISTYPLFLSEPVAVLTVIAVTGSDNALQQLIILWVGMIKGLP